MIAFTYSGQGSQEPGMGAPWVDHPSWELVDEASQAAGRDVSHLLLDAGAGELRETRNAQLATFVTSMVVLDAVERLGIDAEPFHCVEDHHAGHEGRQLGVTCLTKFAGTSVQEQVTNVPAGGLGGLVDQLPGGVVDPWCTHAGFLGSLAGVGESDHRSP